MRNDNFDIIDAKKVATLKWVEGDQEIVLKEGRPYEQLAVKNRDYSAESKRVKELVNRHLSGTH